jgi:benzoate/toluate 1,2-dioxygenase alpha subunit
VGTPDDLAAFEACQRGYHGTLARWQQGYERGVKRMARGADEEAQTLGVQPYSTTSDFRDETIYHGQYRQWLTLMLAGQQRERRESHGA